MRHIKLPSFKPHPLLPGGHLQTIGGHLSPSPKLQTHTRRHFVDLGDGDKLAVDETSPQQDDSARAPILFIFHGLSGCSMSIYAQHLAAKLSSRGARVLRVNHRGCGASAAVSKGIYHAGSFRDVDTVVRSICAKWPDAPVRVSGFSLSGNMILNWVSSEATAAALPSQLKAVLAVSPPIQLELCSLALSRLSNIHFDQYFIRRLIGDARRRSLWPKHRREPKANPPIWCTLRDFDEVFTAPMAGFRNRQEYYEKCSAFQRLHRVATPTLVLSATDDPFVPAASFERAQWSPSTEFRLITSGGHMGFVSQRKTIFGDYRWLDEAVSNWFEFNPA